MENRDHKKSLFRRYADNLYTTEDAHKILDSLQHPEPEGNTAWEELMSEAWEEAGAKSHHTTAEHDEYKAEARLLLKRINHRKRLRTKLLLWSIAGIAAIGLLVVGVGKILKEQAFSHVTYQEVLTAYGERKELLLPDGSQVTLNSCSRICYPNHFVGDERRIELEGEGYFHITPNKKKPFLVCTQRLNVRVLGTQFNVKSYSTDEQISVDVESGKVQVNLPEAMMYLRAHEQLVFNTCSETYTKHCDEHETAVWRKGGLRFNATPLHDVIKELERMYGCQISFAPGEKFDNFISGEHDNPGLEAVLQSIEYTCGIYYEKKGENAYRLYKKENNKASVNQQ